MPSGIQNPTSLPSIPTGVGREIVAQRNDVYANAWARTGVVMAMFGKDLSHLLEVFPEAYLPWTTILCKLLRALGSPHNADHWRDIAGYATLVFEYLQRGDQDVER